MTTLTQDTLETINLFNEAFNRHDVTEIMRLMTDDVVFESTVPPDGDRFEGQDQVAGFWRRLFDANPEAWFETEDILVSGDRCAATWRFTFDRHNAEGGHVRGVDIFRVREGKVAEKLSYVKG